MFWKRAALIVGSLIAYAVIGNLIVHGLPRSRPPVFDEALCQRALLDAHKGHPDPQLIEECRRKGLPKVTRPYKVH